MGDAAGQCDKAIVREIEERSLNVWPALRRIFPDGWILGLSEGYTRRANSVNPIYDGIRDVPDKIPICEETYAGHGLSAVFKVTPMSDRTGLDDLLERRRYEKQATTRVQILTLSAASDSACDGIEELDGVEVLEDVDDAWIHDYARLKRLSWGEALKNRTILDRIGLPKRFVSIVRDGRRVASGIAVVESGWVGLFGIVTDPEMRRMGLGRRVTKALTEAGAASGAEMAYLQVETDNQPAARLYESMGFREVYRYWYRVEG